MVIVKFVDGDEAQFECGNYFYDSDCQMFIIIDERVETRIPREFVKSVQVIF